MSYDEPEDWKLYDLHYRGTKAQANAIWLELIGTDAWRSFEVVDNKLRFGTWRLSSDDPGGTERVRVEFAELCRRRMEHLATVSQIVVELIEKHTG